MEKEKNSQPHVTKNYHFEHVGQYIDYIHTQYVTIDKDAGIQIGEVNNQHSSQPTPQPTQTPSAELDPTPLIFLPNEQNREAIIALLKSTLSISPKKSIVCKKLFEQRALFNLDNFDDTTKANIINAWIKEFQLQQNFKSAFTNQDFYANYSK
jgi:hypothetical protein